ncbi:hypothetical protein HDF16_005555 [Granulicella aggregans]|uniref:Uncharacterized protein n=1 Tax=Granulicella aggregans TaxID=474949 RepID=A0A7W7ZJ11_9BACT|nr:hypothetical protein [Granulicella aggregans]MBB5060819.1 hypothetical protein [Granulicella aggregans]
MGDDQATNDGIQKSEGFVKPLSFEFIIAAVLALINFALDQADIHIMLITWVSLLACVALLIDGLRRTQWAVRIGWKSKSFGFCSFVILLIFSLFGYYLSSRKKALGDTQGSLAISKSSVSGQSSKRPSSNDSAETALPASTALVRKIKSVSPQHEQIAPRVTDSKKPSKNGSLFAKDPNFDWCPVGVMITGPRNHISDVTAVGSKISIDDTDGEISGLHQDCDVRNSEPRQQYLELANDPAKLDAFMAKRKRDLHEKWSSLDSRDAGANMESLLALEKAISDTPTGSELQLQLISRLTTVK